MSALRTRSTCLLLKRNQRHLKARTSIAYMRPCARDLRKYIADLDQLLTVSPISVREFWPLKNLAPKEPCNVDEAISIAKASKFFKSADDMGYAYTITFK